MYTLTDHQQEKGEQIIECIRGGANRINLIGSAGVGKTVLAGWLIDKLRRDRTLNTNYNNGLVYCTAPTNKALAVLKSKVQAAVEFKTIHSALDMKMGYPDKVTGKRKFIKTWAKKRSEFEYAKACLIDECSMLNSDFIGGNKDVAQAYLNSYTFPIIFIGDSAQLNPVGEEKSPVFEQSYPTFELTEIIRQGEGNPIIDLSRDTALIPFKQPNVTSAGKGYIYDDNLDGIISDLAEVNGTDEMKYLAWTNQTVDEMNKLVRERRYGKPAKIEREETIVFNSPFAASFYTNQEVKCEDVETITEYVIVPRYDTKYNRENTPINATDKIKIKYYRINGKIDIVHEDSEFVFKTIQKELDNNCKKHGWSWIGFYAFVERFADITYNHAITVHKSQGSTYKIAVINIGNINFNKNLEEKQRLLYTSITRASDLVILNNVK